MKNIVLLIALIDILLGQSLKGFIEKRGNNSTVELVLSGRPEQGYCLQVNLGTPGQQFSVIVDTGSANFALAGNPHSGISKYFESEISTTYKIRSEREFSVNYFNGSWSGVLGTDLLKLCSKCKSGAVDVALITRSDNFFVNETVYQGLLGLAYHSVIQPSKGSARPVLDSLTESGVFTTDKFNIRLCGKVDQLSTELNGQLVFDPVADNDYIFTDIVKEWYYQVEVLEVAVNNVTLDIACKEYNVPAAFLDSGTTNIVMPQLPYIYTYTAIQDYVTDQSKGEISKNISKFMDRVTIMCFDTKSEAFSLFPELTFTFSYNSSHQFTINLPPEQYIRQTWDSMQQQNNNYCYKFGIEKGHSGMILGAAFMEQLDILHDRPSHRVGFKVAQNCKVTDPVFRKTISTLKPRSDYKENCLSADNKNVLKYMAVVSIILILLILIITIYCFKTFIRIHVRGCYKLLRSKLCPCFEVKYQYMMNSESSVDEIGLGVLCDDVSLNSQNEHQFSLIPQTDDT